MLRIVIILYYTPYFIFSARNRALERPNGTISSKIIKFMISKAT